MDSLYLHRTTRNIRTEDQQIQVDLMSAPFQSSLNQGFFFLFFLFIASDLPCSAFNIFDQSK
jgi:hypothetical protein